MLSPIERFWLLLKPDKKEVFQIYAYAVFNGLVSLSLPLGIQAIVNLIQGGQLSTSWVILVVIVILGVAFTGLMQILQLSIIENLQQRIFTRAAFEFIYRIPRIKLEALYKYYAPELMNRFFDIVSLQKGLSKILMDFSTATLHVLLGMILLSLYHPFFILYSLIIILLVYILFKFTGSMGLKSSIQESEHKYKVAHWLEEVARVNNIFKIAINSHLPAQKTNEFVNNYLTSRNSHFKVLMQQYSLLIIFKIIVVTGLLAIGGFLVMEQKMNIGQFVAAEIIVLLIINSVEKLIQSLETIYDILTSLEKVGKIADMELENVQGVRIKFESADKGLNVEVKNLKFSYPNVEKNILDDISIQINSNDRICLRGNNGSGKSTFLRILAGLYSPQSGNIVFNELPMGNYHIEELRSFFGCCFLKEGLFEGTLAENITLKRPNISDVDLKNAITNVGLGEFVKKLPLGYETPLDSNTDKLPESIIQKICLARAIAHQPKLLLIDNILGSIEEKERHLIIDFLTDPKNNWTLIMISSDPYVEKKCKQIITMDNGRIISLN